MKNAEAQGYARRDSDEIGSGTASEKRLYHGVPNDFP
jgi:hypothetical protein